MDVRIGIVQSAKEIEVELEDEAERDKVIAEIESSLSGEEGVLWLTDRRGRRVAVPVAKVAYVEVGAPDPRAPGGVRRPLRPLQSLARPVRVNPSQPAGLLDRRLLFVTGKGGVGKTSVSSALALLRGRAGQAHACCARWTPRGTLAASSRPGPTNFTAREVLPGLSLMSMDTEASLREYLRLSLRIPIVGRIGPLAKAFDFVATAAPGVREILTVGKLCYEVRERHYDLVVVDASATGHIVGQLSAPQAINDLVKVGLIRSQTDWILDILSDPVTHRAPHRDHARGDARERDHRARRARARTRRRSTSPPWSSTASCPSCSDGARRRSSASSASRPPPASSRRSSTRTPPRCSTGRAWP